jgi:fructoselysine-6-P-deglycase FrlB-like protein
MEIHMATMPLKPIETVLEKFQETIDLRDQIREFVSATVEAGVRNVYFVGAGGSLICSYPAYYLLQRESTIPTFQIQSDELNCSVPKLLGPGSLVVLASYTGKTKETVAAAKTAKRAGATVLVAAKAGTPLAEAADVSFEAKSDVFELLVAYALLEGSASDVDLADVTTALTNLPKVLHTAVESIDDQLREIAEALKDEPITYVLGSGASYAWAYGFSMCFLQEMQWKHAAGFNTGEFFQGAFEMVNDDTAVLLWLGDDQTRPMAERGKAFLETYCAKAQYVDVRDLELDGLPDSVRGDFSPLVVAVLAHRLAQQYESVRGHDLEQRHYMFKVDY